MGKHRSLGIVADASYLYHAKEILGANVDYALMAKLGLDIAGPGLSLGPSIVHLKDIPGQGKFLSSLRSAGYQYFCKDWDSASPGWIHELGKSVLDIVPYVDKLVVAVGDGRLASVIDFVSEVWDVNVYAIGFKQHTDDDILDAAISFTELSDSICYRRKLSEPATT